MAHDHVPGAGCDTFPDFGLSKMGDDRLREECGVFGVFGHPEAAAITALGLHALQHRGQEAAGIVTFDGKQFHTEKRMGLVGDHYTDPATLAKLPGSIAIGGGRPFSLPSRAGSSSMMPSGSAGSAAARS